MKTTLRVLLDIVARVAVFLAAEWALIRVYEANVPATPGDADIGEGLLAFALMFVLALLWGAWDGYRRGFGRAAVVWLATGTLIGAVLAVTLGVGVQATSPGQLLADVADSVPFLACLVAVPALVTAAAAALVRMAVSPAPSPH